MALAGKADLVVTADGMSGIKESLVEDLDKIPGFAAVVPSLQKPARMYGQDSAGKPIQATVQVMGVDPVRDKAVREFELTDGRYFEKNGEAVVDSGLARSLGLSVGQKVRDELGTTFTA